MSGRRRGRTSIADYPALVGAATTLLVAVAVFLAYNANAGLPWVPAYRLSAELPNAASLVPGNEVRIGGAQVGVVEEIAPVRHADGSVSARLDLKLETRVEPLPADSTLVVRSRSALGLKYLELEPGSSPRGLPGGGRIPIANARPEPVEVDELLNTFDGPTRAAARANLRELGDALAGRGADLNRAIEALGPLLGTLEPVMRDLADPGTRLARLVRELGEAAAIVAPAAETQARLFANLDATFGALAGVARPHIQDSISKGPGALAEATERLPRLRPLLANAKRLMEELGPGIAALRRAAPHLAAGLAAGTPALERSPALNGRLESAFGEIERFAEDPAVPLGLRRLAETVRSLDPTLAFLTPAQTVCNYLTLWFRNVASLLSEGDERGTWQRFIIIAAPRGPNNEGGPSSAPAGGPERDNYLHANPYPNTAAPGQPRECEAGNEPYLAGRQAIGGVAGGQGTSTDRRVGR